MPSDTPGQEGDAKQAQAAPRSVIALVLTGLTAALLLQAIPPWWSGRAVEVDRLPQHEYDFRIDVNQANEMELIHLPGIGPTLAQRVVANRKAQGPFESVEDLRRVRGIGPKLVKRIAPYLRWPQTQPLAGVPAPAAPRPTRSKTESGGVNSKSTSKVDLK